MARKPTPTLSPVMLQPQASPVDTFVAPRRAQEGNALVDFARSLVPLGGELQTYFGQLDAEKRKEEDARLEADFFRANGEGLAEAVRQGIIPAHHSKDYARNYKRLQGDTLARRLEAGWLPAYESWAGKNSDDPAAFDGFVATYIRSNVGTDDPDIIAGLAPRMRQFGAEAQAAHTRYRSGEVRREALTSNLAAVNSRLDDAHLDGLTSGNGTDVASTADAIEKQRAAYIATGGRGSDFDENGMKLIAAKAVELEDTDLLKFFDRTIPGTTYTYGDTPDGGLLKADAEEKIGVRRRQSIVEDDKAAEKDRKAREDAATVSAIDALSTGAAVPEGVLAAGQNANPRFRTFIGEWRDNLSKGERDPQLMRQIQADIMSGKGMGAVMEAAPTIRSPEDMKEAIAFAKSFEGSRPKVDDVLGSSALKTTLDVIETRTKKASGGMFDPISGMSFEGLEAQYDLRMMMTRWAVEHPNASSLDRDKAIAENSRIVFDRLTPSPDGDGVSIYPRDPAAVGGFANPYSGLTEAQKAAGEDGAASEPGILPPSMGGQVAPAPETTQPAPVAPSANDAPPEGITTSAQRDYFARFPAEEQTKLKDLAGKKGQPLGALLDHLKSKNYPPKPSGATAPDGTPIDPVSFRPGGLTSQGGEPSRQAIPAAEATQVLRAVASGGATRGDSFSGMKPEFAGGLAGFVKNAPGPLAGRLGVFSGYRSPVKQAQLWKAALNKYGSAAEARKWVAPPGRSGHNHGHAADLTLDGKRLDTKNFSAAQIKEVHDWAEQSGLSFPLGNEAWHVELAGARGGSGRSGERRTFTPQDAESFLTAAMDLDALDLPGPARDKDGSAFVQGDVPAGRLLDLIGQNESGGNYNAVFGNADATRDLGKLSLNSIIRQQAASKRRGAGSTAIGKYQFLRKTLESLKEELGLSGEETFTPDLQDRLAVALLERRGYSKFRAGGLSMRQFARRLSQEWSSIENPGTGRSYYAGDGIHNRAPTKSQQVYAALGFSA